MLLAAEFVPEKEGRVSTSSVNIVSVVRSSSNHFSRPPFAQRLSFHSRESLAKLRVNMELSYWPKEEEKVLVIRD